MQAQRASALVRCHACAFSSRPLRPSPPPSGLSRRSPGPSFSAFASSQARASERNFASTGVSLKSMGWVLLGLRRESQHELVAPFGGAAEPHAELLRAAVQEMAVVLPGVSEAAIHLDHLGGRELEGVSRGGARGARRGRALRIARRE